VKVYLSNQSTKITNEDAYAIAIACDWQMRRHAIGLWQLFPSQVRYLAEGVAAERGTAVIGFFDNADQAGDLGWHTEGPDGIQYGRVFTEPVLQAGGGILTGSEAVSGLSVCSVASHECLELVFDPSCNRWADNGSGALFAWECADPVESDSYPVTIPPQTLVSGAKQETIQATVSNFVLPAWFDPSAAEGTQLDYMSLCTAPFEVRPTGYVVTMTDGTVSQTFGEQYPEWRKAMKSSELSRTARRRKETHRTIEGELRLLGGHL
jgi:hypothetical protein